MLESHVHTYKEKSVCVWRKDTYPGAYKRVDWPQSLCLFMLMCFMFWLLVSHELQPTRLLQSMRFPGKNARVAAMPPPEDSTQGSNQAPHCKQILYQLTLGKPGEYWMALTSSADLPNLGITPCSRNGIFFKQLSYQEQFFCKMLYCGKIQISLHYNY